MRYVMLNILSVSLTFKIKGVNKYEMIDIDAILQFEGRKYCEHDFHVLFAPCCGKCGK